MDSSLLQKISQKIARLYFIAVDVWRCLEEISCVLASSFLIKPTDFSYLHGTLMLLMLLPNSAPRKQRAEQEKTKVQGGMEVGGFG